MNFNLEDWKIWRSLFFDWLVENVHAQNKDLSIREIKGYVREANKTLQQAVDHEKALLEGLPDNDL
jgi:hypothetical protein